MALHTCTVSYRDSINFDFEHSVEVMAESLYEATALGIRAMKLSASELHRYNFTVAAKEPVVYHSVSGAALSAWVAFPGKSQREIALKKRVKQLLKY